MKQAAAQVSQQKSGRRSLPACRAKRSSTTCPRSPADTDADVKLTAPYSADFEAAQSWRKTVPAAGPAVTFHLPVPSIFTLKNGLKILLVEDSSLPVLSIDLVSRSGGETNPPGNAGLAAFTAGMLTEGTAMRSATQLAEDSERIGTRLSSASSMDGTTTGISVLSNNTHAALALLSDIVLHPAFNPPDLERVRRQRMVAIQQESDQPQAIALRVGPRLLYGNQPYGFTNTGTVDSIQSITREQMLAFWSQHYGPQDSALILSGDIKEKDARLIAERYFGGWPLTDRIRQHSS